MKIIEQTQQDEEPESPKFQQKSQPTIKKDSISSFSSHNDEKQFKNFEFNIDKSKSSSDKEAVVVAHKVDIKRVINDFKLRKENVKQEAQGQGK